MRWVLLYLLLLAVPIVAAVPSGSVLYLTFEDDIADGVATDSSGNGLHPTCSGIVCPWYSPGEGFDGGAAYSFDGRDHVLFLNDPGSGWTLDIPNAITIAAWVRPSTLTGVQSIIAKDDIYEFRLSNGRAATRLNNDNSPSANTQAQVDVWQHIALTWDGTTRQYYYNGQPDGTSSKSGSFVANNNDVGIGARPTQAYVFNGMLDEVLVYDRALSAQEIQSIYTTPLADGTAPQRFKGRPSGAIPSATQTIIAVTTNEAATCRYATTPGVSYASMSNTFATTVGMEHFETVPVQGGQSYTYYVRCQDRAGNQNTNDFVITFSVDQPVPSDPSFIPQDLAPSFYIESVATFPNPHTNADCTGFENPNYCCNGPGTGTCDQPVESFYVVNNQSRNIDCTAPGVPNVCCTGVQTGSCAYEEPDNAYNGLGTSYCPASVCPDGCVNRWADQSGRKSPVASHAITGYTFEQDDLEKPCYKQNCINGHACAVGHGAWKEPDYPPAEQPYQDATMEIEPADRVGPLRRCSGPFYIAQLVKIVPQSEDHYLLAGHTKYRPGSKNLQLEQGPTLSADGAIPTLNEWYFIEIQRNLDYTLQLWVNEQDKTRSPTPSSLTLAPWSTQNFCGAKTCDSFNAQEFQGEAALMFYRCGSLSTQEQADLRDYVLTTFAYDSAIPQCHWADADCNADISISELVTVVLDWQSGSRSIAELVEVVLLWQS